MTQQYTSQKPGMFTALSIMTLVSGILNVFYGLTITALIVIGTIGLGLLCAPLTILPSILGIFEILYAVKLLSNPQQPVQFSQAIAILEICCFITGNILSAVAGVLALVFYNDLSVKQYFAQINSPAPLQAASQIPPM